MATRSATDNASKTITIRISSANGIEGGSVLIEDNRGGSTVVDYTVAQATAIGTGTQRTNTRDYLLLLVADALSRANFT